MLSASVLGLAILGLASCGEKEVPTGGTTIELVDEEERPIRGARIDIGTVRVVSDGNGRAQLGEDAAHPLLAIIEADGFLSDVVPIGSDEQDGVVRVELLSDLDGQRWVMHTAGDVMFGRRYQSPSDDDDSALLPIENMADGARDVVAAMARAFAAADLRMVNLESAVTDEPDQVGYPGKRFVLRTPPEALAGLKALGVDIAVLANNHIRDFLDRGVRDTLDALAEAEIAAVGAAAGSEDDATQAAAPVIFAIDGSETAGAAPLQVGVLAWSTLSGAAANDSFPRDGDIAPTEISADQAWQYEERMWSFEGPSWSVTAEPRRIGSAWRLFDANESRLQRTEVEDAWNSLTGVYPELQDWVARRGHGGAAYWQRTAAQAAITALTDSVDVVVVQLHAGYNFQSAPSSYTREAARAAIDAGAAIVIVHHPHVLQGAEWYRDGLIAYSMGNFVFDQDFLLTFSGAFLRTVWERDTLLEARYVLTELDGYRPYPVTGEAAQRAARILWEKSQLGATCDDVDGDVRAILDDEIGDAEAVRPAHVRWRHHSAVLSPVAPAAVTHTLMLPSDVTVALAADGLVRPPSVADVSLGRSLFGWGHFEDLLADGESRAGTHWDLGDDSKEVILGPYAYRGEGYLRLRRTAGGELSAFVRPVARIPLPAQRVYRWQDGDLVGADGQAHYSIRFIARLAGGGDPFITLSLYRFDDGNPSEEPTSKRLAEHELAIDIAADGQWHEVELAIPDEVLQQEPERANSVLMYLRLRPPDRGEAYFDIDDLSVIEWRSAQSLQDRLGAFDFAKNHATENRTIEFEIMPLE